VRSAQKANPTNALPSRFFGAKAFPFEGRFQYLEVFSAEPKEPGRDYSMAATDEAIRTFREQAIKAMISDCEYYNSRRAVQYARQFLDREAVNAVQGRERPTRLSDMTFARYCDILEKLPSLKPVWDELINNREPCLFGQNATKDW
jgi:hypothetical protein